MSDVQTFIIGFAILILFGWYFGTDKERIKRILGTLLTITVCFLCISSAYPPFDVPQKDAAGKPVLDEAGRPKLEKTGQIALGIDLKGGTSWLVRIQPTAGKEISKEMLDRAMETIRTRVDSGGVAEPVIAPAGTDRILVQLPGIDPKLVESYRQKLQQVAKLEFRLVHPENEQLAEQVKNKLEILDPAYELKNYIQYKETVGPDGKKIKTKVSEEPLLVKRETDIPGSMVERAFATYGTEGWEIVLIFNEEGGKLFGELTKAHVGKRFAIMLDNEVYSAPNIKEAIYGGRANISGGGIDEAEAHNLSSVLENPLENPVSMEEERSTSPSLGQDAISSGLKAGEIGAIITVLVVLLYYRFAGLIANLALVVFIVILFGSMGMFNAVLTLPGIAGILLTLGMAIDANVLIYERLREEQAAGKSLSASLSAAYDKAFSAIFDSNITTLITAVILYWKATGPVKGFAVSLVIGVVASMFTALVVTRNLFEWTIAKGWIKKITMTNLIPATNFNFMGKRKATLTLSALVILGSIGLFVYNGDKNLGVDFRGGERLVMSATEGALPNLEAVRVETEKFGDNTVQTEKSSTTEFITIRCAEGKASEISAALQKTFPKLKEDGREQVGSVVGGELAKNSLIALGLGMLGILIYVTLRFEFSFAIGALVALLHDVIITVGIFALMGRELSLVIVGAVLTIAGYSVNDTIVVYDRIREGIKSGRKGSILQIMNASINETLSRTILTGGVTLLTTIVLFMFGGPVLSDFALTMMIGILVGTYSSIFIAAPIVLWWSGRGGRDLKSEVKQAEEQAVVPV